MAGSDQTRSWDAVIFDLDGTLIDSAPDIQTSINIVLGEDGLTPLSLSIVTSFIGNGIGHLVRLAYLHRGKELNEPDLVDRTARFAEVYARRATERTAVYPGVLKGIRRLFDQRIKLAICTNKPVLLAEKILQGLELRSYFEVVIGGDSCRTRKPNPEPVLACCDALQVESRHCLYVGDSETDVEAARAAGLSVTLVTYGYPKKPVEDLGADDLVPSLDYLMAPKRFA